MPALLPIADLAQMPSLLLAQAQETGIIETVLRHPEALFFSFLATVIVVPALAGMWVSMRTKEWEASLKHSMLERGMSADEIEKVLNAGTGRAGFRKWGCRNSVAAGACEHSATEGHGPAQTA